MASEELVNRLRERATTLWQWAGKAERTTGPSATTEQWRIDGDLHDDAATEIDRLARELEATRAALRIAQTTAANLHDTIRLRDRELAAARSHARRLCVALRAIRDEAAIGGPPLESRREDWEAAMDEADEVLGELEALYGE